MTIFEFAEKLNGRQRGDEIIVNKKIDEEIIAKENGFVIVFGYSDDNAELRGAIYDEVSCYDGGTIYLNGNGIITECECECEHYIEKLNMAKQIEIVWNNTGEPNWTYETDIPHATFNIYDGEGLYCRGIVFDLNNLG